MEAYQQQLVLYQQQLAVVDAQLRAAPGNAQRRELRGSIIEFVDEAREMLGLPKAAHPPPPLAPPVPAAAASSLALPRVEATVGAYVAAHFPAQGKVANALVTEAPAPGGRTCTVMFIGFATTAEVAVAALQPPRFLREADVERVMREGGTVEGIYSEDGLWYAARVDGQAPDGRWNVTYTEYGNKEAIDIRHMRLPPSSAAPAPAPERPASPTAATAPAAKPDKGGAPKRKADEPAFDPNAEFVIPEKLRILPTDSEDVKASKRKKVHALKSNFRLKKNEAEKTGRANSWKSFESAKPGKKIKGFMASKAKQSMFRTDEDGAGRVGVIGSGKKQTEWKQIDVHAVKRQQAADEEEED